MAQWWGQFTGNTHLSKIRDLESQLRHAVDIYRECDTQLDRNAQTSNVLRFADQLLRARVKATKARVAALDPRMIDERDQIERRLKQLLDDGVRSIVDEFDAKDIKTN